MLLSSTYINFSIGISSDQFIQLKKIARLSVLHRLAFSSDTARLNQFAANTFGKIPLSLDSDSASSESEHAREERRGTKLMEPLITALSSDLYPAYYSVRINPRATTANERVGAHRTKSKLNSAATLTRLHEPGEIPAKISIAHVIPLNECTF